MSELSNWTNHNIIFYSTLSSYRFTFPSVFIIYVILSGGLIELIYLIGKIDQKSLFCSSQDLLKTLDNATVFCTLSGTQQYTVGEDDRLWVK